MVRVKRLDSLDLPAPDLLKIDVEGHELDVLTGGTRLIDQCRPVLVMENSFHDREPERTLRPLTFLEHRGYELYQLMWEVEVDGRYFLTRRLPAAGDGAVNTLALVPLCSEDRLAIPLIINVVACPRERSVGVAGRFEQRAP